jgi:acyl-CoA synthetase (AMP-forming)/AMP-acid ligase II
VNYLPQLKSVADIARHYREKQPQQVALKLDATEVSYGALDEGSNQVANALIEQGLNRGDRIVWLGRNSCRYFECLIGASKAGVTPVCVNWRLTPFEIEQIVGDADPALILTDQEFRAKISDQVTAHIPLLITDAEISDPDSYDGWKSTASTTDPMRDDDPEATCMQIYTSGTTGHPKGAMIAHRSLLALMRSACSTRHGDMGPGDKVLVPMPIFHVSGSTYGLNVLYAGATVILHADVNPELMVRDISKLGITHTFVVPTVIQMMLTVASADATAFSSMKAIGYGAAPIAQPLLERAMQQLQCGFRQVYGMTEMTGAIAILTPEEHSFAVAEKPSLLKSCGKPVEGCELRILDNSGNALAPGEIGEIVLKGDMLMSRYWRRPEATAETVRDGWYFSGDAGYTDEDGFLYICDRIKDSIISGGENIYPAEIESVLMEHAGIVDAAVVGVPNKKWGEEVKAFIVAAKGTPGGSAGGSPPSVDDVLNHCRGKLASFKMPKSVEFIAALPRNGAGKVQKTILREPYLT